MFSRMSLKMKLGLGFGGLLAILLAMGIIGYTSASTLDRLSGEVEASGNEAEWTVDVQAALEMQAAGVRGFLITGKEDMLQRDEEGKVQFRESMEKLEKAIALAEGKKLAAQVTLDYESYRAILDREVELRRGGKTTEAMAQVADPHGAQLRSDLRRSTAALIQLQNRVRQGSRSRQQAIQDQTKTLTLGLTFAGIIMGLGIAFAVIHAITGAIARMVAMIQEIAANNLTVPDLKIISQDEIGRAGLALNSMKNNLHEVIRSIAASSLQVASASEELNSTSLQITANSEETSAQADVVTRAAQTVSQNLHTVATGAEEMGASIREIAKNATDAAKVATAAVRVAETTTATVSKLGDSSTEIGEVIKVITSIAQQTNLLALNATIEAARAGEAGKGFAVVANEVKELAKETAKATEDISRKIEAIQSDTKAAVDAISTIRGVINQVNDISITIATAVEEQNATTNEMSRNVSEAAQGSGEITSNIAGVAEAAQSITRGARDTQKASQQLVETSAQLRRLVEQFKLGNCGQDSAGDVLKLSSAARAGV